ncbi:MAG: hypothetical protein JWR38_5805 [Mucilaginibacter sp.]|nr:hypothetical protein [Mucilaginibacter sp.]
MLGLSKDDRAERPTHHASTELSMTPFILIALMIWNTENKKTCHPEHREESI